MGRDWKRHGCSRRFHDDSGSSAQCYEGDSRGSISNVGYVSGACCLYSGIEIPWLDEFGRDWKRASGSGWSIYGFGYCWGSARAYGFCNSWFIRGVSIAWCSSRSLRRWNIGILSGAGFSGGFRCGWSNSIGGRLRNSDCRRARDYCKQCYGYCRGGESDYSCDSGCDSRMRSTDCGGRTYIDRGGTEILSGAWT